MAKYDSLKDFFQGEHLGLITRAVKEQVDCELKADCQVSAICVKSLECINNDPLGNVEYELGVLADLVIDNIIVNRSFILTITGNLERKLNAINVVGIMDIDESDFPKDNLLSQFILHDWPESELEIIGNEMYKFYDRLGLYGKYKLNIPILVDREMLYFAPLPEDCLGRVILSEVDVEVIQKGYIMPMVTRTIHASLGTILLNYKHYGVNMDGGLRVTVAHELIHSAHHRNFFKILHLLGEEKVDLNSSIGAITNDENMTDIQKALYIAEWQANELGMRLAMPEITIEAVIDDMAYDYSYFYDNKGDWIQGCINKIAIIYGVSLLIAKVRLRQLGYDSVDGTCLGSDDDRKKAFYFPLGTLKNNESFVINRSNFERLLRENADFAELINSGRYIYIGHVVCVFSSKYVTAVTNSENDEVIFELSDYAREHADECLIKFKYKSITKTNDFFPIYISPYLNKMPDYNKVSPESFELSKEDTGLDQKTIDDIEQYNDEWNELNSNQKSTFSNTIIYYMKDKNIDDSELAKRTRLKPTAISKIISGKTKTPDPRNVMAICIALELSLSESIDLFMKLPTKYNIMNDTLQNRAYRYIIENQYFDLDECNKILRHFDQSELPYHKGQM